MNYLRISLVVLLALGVSSLTSATRLAFPANAQNQSTALERGYRTGYSDGYNAGTRDTVDSAARDYRNKQDYQQANRSYNEAWGTIEDYRDGYQQGFEAGYTSGFDRRPFDSTIPTGLKTRGVVDSSADTSTDNSAPASVNSNSQTVNTPAAVSNPLYIARDTILLVELESSLSTDASQRGDRFQARVIDPREFSGATVEGRITRVKRAGKVKGTAELQLSFETIHMPDGRSTGFNAVVVELIDMGNRDEAGTVDSEGGVKGKDSTKDDISRVGASAGIGAVIGAIFGGGKGAAIGAVLGGAAGTGSVMTRRGKELRLDRGQQMRIRAATESRIQ